MATVEQAVKRYEQSMGSTATKEKYREGIANTTVNPMQVAADHEEDYLRGVEESVRSGRRKEKLLATPVSSWKNPAMGKGADRLSSGAMSSLEKVRAAHTKFKPVYDDIAATAKTMPKRTSEEQAAVVLMAIQRLKAGAGKR